MSEITLIALIGGVLIAIIIGVYLMQYRKRAREMRERHARKLAGRHKQLLQLAQDVPSPCLPVALRKLLASEGLRLLDRLAELEAASSLSEFREHWQAFAESQPERAAPAAGNETSLNETRQLLKILIQFLDQQVRKKACSASQAKEIAAELEFHYGRVLADAHAMRADFAEKNGKPRVAIHHLHEAVSAYAHAQDNARATQAIGALQKRIRQLEKSAREQRQDETEGPERDDNQLASGLDSFEQDEDQWKKKQAYDD